MKILVTGASGFVGRRLLELLNERGHSTFGVDLKPSDATGAGGVLDLRDPEAVSELVKVVRPEAIAHSGAISGPMLFCDRPAFVAQSNIGSTLNLLEAARTLGARRFVFCSSIAVYGDRKAEDPIGEDVPLTAETPYAASKIAGEALAQSYRRSQGLSAVSTRIGRVYGPGRVTDCILRDLIRAGLDGRPIELEAVEDVQHFIHVDDVARGLAAMTEAPALAHDAYNLVTSEARTLAETATLVGSLLPGLGWHSREGAAKGGREPSALSSTRLMDELGFEPEIPLARGVQEYVSALIRSDG